METNEEIELARDLLAGRPEAFERFVDVYQAKVFNYSLLMCRHREDAEEVAQETLLNVFTHFDQLREAEKVRGWVFRIARNACYMKRRKSVFAPAQELSLEELMPLREGDGDGARIQIADWAPLPDSELLRGELRKVLDSAIAELPDIYRAVILLRDVEELSTEETAQVLDVSPDVVKTRLHRARLAVRQKLDIYLREGRKV